METHLRTRLRSRGAAIYPGWWVVLACAVIGAYGGGVYFYGFTLFFNPLREELGLTSTQTSFIFSLTRLEGAFEGVIVGYLIDRFGARRIMMVGVPLTGLGFILWGTVVHGYLMFALVYVGVIATGINAGFFHPGLTVANNWFIRRRATAMSLMGTSMGVGGAILVPLVGVSIATFGWRATAILAGAILLIFIVPLTLLVHHRPEDRGLRPDGDAAPTPPPEAAPSSAATVDVPRVPVATAPPREEDYTVGEAFRTRAMWILLAAVTIRFFTHTALMVHFAPILIDRGFSLVAAGGAVGLLALLSVPTRLLAGWLGDRFTPRKVIAVLLFFDALGLLVLLNATTAWQVYLFIALWAAGYGAGILNWVVVGNYYGRARFATIRGVMGAVYSGGAMLGPLYAGWVYDRTGSYDEALIVFLAGTLGAAVLYAFGPAPRRRAS
jgi:sugar phosphate permease